MTQAELRRLARIGVEARLEALQREIAAIYQVFPELRRGRSQPAPNPYTAGVRAAVAGAVTRRRRPRLSREARKRIADAQGKRWTEWRAKRSGTDIAAGSAKPKTRRESRKRK